MAEIVEVKTKLGEVKYIDIDDIVIDPLQSRMGKWRGDEEDEALVNSMKGVGQIQDVIIRPIGGTNKPYSLVAGSRRYHALIKAGKPKIRCIVRDMDDVEAIETSISENIGRKDLTQFEKSEAVWKWYILLMKNRNIEPGEAQKELATKMFGNEKRYPDVWQLLASKEKLPEQVRILLKKPSERTKKEKELLAKYDIPLYFTADQKLTRGLVSLSISLESMPDKEKTDKFLSMVTELGLQYLTDEAAYQIVLKVRDLVKEGNPFSIAVHHAMEEQKKFEIERAYHIEFFLPTQRYWGWHERACERAHMTARELVQKVYVDWLEREAKKERW